jgi:hypothetical protein
MLVSRSGESIVASPPSDFLGPIGVPYKLDGQLIVARFQMGDFIVRGCVKREVTSFRWSN